MGYYRRFVPSFADLAEPLVALTGKDVPFVWRLACTTAFVSLRDALVRAPVFAFPTETGPYILDTDASNFGADVLVYKIILRFGMPLVIHSDQGREFENGLMKSLCPTGWWNVSIARV